MRGEMIQPPGLCDVASHERGDPRRLAANRTEPLPTWIGDACGPLPRCERRNLTAA